MYLQSGWETQARIPTYLSYRNTTQFGGNCIEDGRTEEKTGEGNTYRFSKTLLTLMFCFKQKPSSCLTSVLTLSPENL